MAHETKNAEDFESLWKMGTVVTDFLGRKIKIRKPKRLAKLKLAEAIGSVAENDRYYRMVEHLLYVEEIDGLPFSIGSTKREVEAAYDRLGDEGETAIGQFFLDNVTKENENEIIEIAKEKEILKKS